MLVRYKDFYAASLPADVRDLVNTEGGEDIFAHYSMIQMDGYRTLKAGQQVSFVLQQGPKGRHATEIQLASEKFKQQACVATVAG